MTTLCKLPSPVGRLTIASDGQNVTGLWMEGQKYYGSTLDNKQDERILPVFDKAKKWLNLYFSGKEPDFTLPLAPMGSAFRQAVWRILCAIPYGETRTYGDIARELGRESGGKGVSAQAVGGAVGHNPISILIPCHRVVGTNGSLTGYAGGIEKKVRLLRLEGVNMERMFIPKRGTAL